MTLSQWILSFHKQELTSVECSLRPEIDGKGNYTVSSREPSRGSQEPLLKKKPYG